MADDQASEELFELLIESWFIHLGCLLESFGELFGVDEGIDVKGLSHDAELLEYENVLGESSCFIAENVVDQAEVLKGLQVLDLAALYLSSLHASFFVHHLDVVVQSRDIHQLHHGETDSQVKRNGSIENQKETKENFAGVMLIFNGLFKIWKDVLMQGTVLGHPATIEDL